MWSSERLQSTATSAKFTLPVSISNSCTRCMYLMPLDYYPPTHNYWLCMYHYLLPRTTPISMVVLLLVLLMYGMYTLVSEQFLLSVRIHSTSGDSLYSYPCHNIQAQVISHSFWSLLLPSSHNLRRHPLFRNNTYAA